MSIELHIERLVIDAAVLGSERADGVRAAIERELARQLAQPGVTSSLREVGAVPAMPRLTLPTTARPREPLGTRIAAAVHQSLDPGAMRDRGATRNG